MNIEKYIKYNNNVPTVDKSDLEKILNILGVKNKINQGSSSSIFEISNFPALILRITNLKNNDIDTIQNQNELIKVIKELQNTDNFINGENILCSFVCENKYYQIKEKLIPFIDFINTNKIYPIQFYIILFQIIISIYYLQQKIKLVHNDLHPKNILIARYNNHSKFIEYNINGMKYVIPNIGILVKLSDFEYSYFEYNNKKYINFDITNGENNEQIYNNQTSFSSSYDFLTILPRINHLLYLFKKYSVNLKGYNNLNEFIFSPYYSKLVNKYILNDDNYVNVFNFINCEYSKQFQQLCISKNSHINLNIGNKWGYHFKIRPFGELPNINLIDVANLMYSQIMTKLIENEPIYNIYQ